MKHFITLVSVLIICGSAVAQQDSTKTGNDTMRIGNILIIKKGGLPTDSSSDGFRLGRTNKSRKANSRFSTNYMVFDIGFSGYSDKTNYGNTGSYLVNKPGSAAFGPSDFKTKGASLNVNIWFLMQTFYMIKKNVNLKYGLGVELNNYRYKSNISYRENGAIPYSTSGAVTNDAFIFRDSIAFKKNKLAADYLTVPLMLNFATNKYTSDKGFSASIGVSAGYLYSQRNKQKSEARGKKRNKGDYDLERFKLSYIAELGIGAVKLYGSYSPQSMYEHDLQLKPYNVGLRFSFN